jgi:hypothetical protein
VRTLFFVATGVALVAGSIASAALAVGMPGHGHARVTRASLKGVNFVESCAFSHRAPDDPIVHAGMPGMSHDHSFVGNVSTNAFSTLASLQAAGTTCKKAADTAAYWMPTLYQGTTQVLPVGATIYYRRNTLAAVRPFPSGLKIVAGDAMATTPQSLGITYWNCGVEGGVKPTSTVPTCPAGRRTMLRLHVRFPSCWDGHSLDSADHKSHMAYPVANRCPAGYPVAVPAIELIFRYAIQGGSDVSLASGGQFSAHGDFFNAWQQPVLRHFVNGCLNALVHCGQG